MVDSKIRISEKENNPLSRVYWVKSIGRRVPPAGQLVKARVSKGKGVRMEKNGEKKRRMGVTVNLEPEAVRVVKAYLQAQNQTFSNWVNFLVVEMAKQVEGMPTPFDKPIGKLTVEEFGELIGYWKRSIEQVEGQ